MLVSLFPRELPNFKSMNLIGRLFVLKLLPLKPRQTRQYFLTLLRGLGMSCALLTMMLVCVGCLALQPELIRGNMCLTIKQSWADNKVEVLHSKS